MRNQLAALLGIAVLAACTPGPNGSIASTNPKTEVHGAAEQPASTNTGGSTGTTGTPNANPDQSVSSDGSSPATTGGTPSSPEGTTGNGAHSNPNPGTVPGVESTPRPRGPEADGTPQKPNWKPSDVDPKKFAELMDQTLYELEDASAMFRVIFQDKAGAGGDEGKIMIASRSKYNIESFRMDAVGKIMKDRANGSKRMTLGLETWSDAQDLPGEWASDESDIYSRWWRDFPRLQFRPILSSRPCWFLLVKQLRAEGYTVTVKTTEMQVNGKMRPFYQLAAKPRDKSKWEMECRVDGIRRLALTIRLSKGVEVRQWSAMWGFEQPVDVKVYELPAKNPASTKTE